MPSSCSRWCAEALLPALLLIACTAPPPPPTPWARINGMDGGRFSVELRGDPTFSEADIPLTTGDVVTTRSIMASDSGMTFLCTWFAVPHQLDSLPMERQLDELWRGFTGRLDEGRAVEGPAIGVEHGREGWFQDALGTQAGVTLHIADGQAQFLVATVPARFFGGSFERHLVYFLRSHRRE